MKIKDQVAIVTGASSEIGMATARLLTKQGAKVALVARSKDILKKLAKELPDSLPITANITKENDNGFKLPPPDSADYVAGKNVEAIESEKAEIFAHDWMNR